MFCNQIKRNKSKTYGGVAGDPSSPTRLSFLKKTGFLIDDQKMYLIIVVLTQYLPL